MADLKAEKNAATANSKEYDTTPPPLEDLRPFVTPEVYQWLHEGDVEALQLQNERDECGTDMITNLFQTTDDDSDDEDDGAVDDNSDASDADYLGFTSRIRAWTSSTTNKDGLGGAVNKQGQIVYRTTSKGNQKNTTMTAVEEQDDGNCTAITAIYALSEAWEGWGFMLWASSRHLANSLVNPESCRRLLGSAMATPTATNRHRALRHHPLHNLSVLELGAGCGLPSLVAMQLPTRAVVVTDLDLPNRIRCLAESIQRTSAMATTTATAVNTVTGTARACPFKWGTSKEQVIANLKDAMGEEGSGGEDDPRFDVICATDCLFMPWLHIDLLQSVDQLMAEQGVCLLAFCIHAAFSKSDEVWSFVDKAKVFERCPFAVAVVEAVQLTPPKKGMPLEQGLVHVLRLTRAGMDGRNSS